MQAEPFLADAIAKHPDDISLLYKVATLRVIEEDYHEAVRLYREVLRLDPKHIATLNNLATLLGESPQSRKEA